MLSMRWSRIVALAPLALIGVVLSGVTTARGAAGGPVTTGADSVDWKAVDAAMGRTGAMQPGEVQKYAFPRSDLAVRIGDVTIKPALALGGWVAFKANGSGAMAMGDLVLLESEVSPVMRSLQAGGIELTALHNHLLSELPHLMYMHINAQGDPVALARAIHAALALTATPAVVAATTPPPALALDTGAIAQALGYHGKVNGGVYQVSVPRQDMVRMGDMEIPPSMGVATAINFQSTGASTAAITGDFVMTADEVEGVTRTLREQGITVTALHSHMLMEEPRLLFMHFWANDDAVKLARSLHSALSGMKVLRP